MLYDMYQPHNAYFFNEKKHAVYRESISKKRDKLAVELAEVVNNYDYWIIFNEKELERIKKIYDSGE